jgi:hypothetical protein
MNFPGFVGPSASLFSTKADCQRTENLMLERIESGQGVNSNTFYRSPGLRQWLRPALAGRWRGLFERNDHVIGLLDGTIYDLTGPGVGLTYGPIADDGSSVTMAASPTSVLFVSAGMLYRLNSAALTTPVLTFTPVAVIFIANYFVALADDMQQFYFSRDDGATWNAGDVQTAEASGNNLLAMIVQNQTLFIYGNRITQPFLVGTNANRPFIPQPNAVIRMGILAPASLAELGVARFWLGRNADGQGVVYKSTGYDFAKISTHDQDNAIRGFAGPQNAVGWVHQTNGHDFYRLTFPAADVTLEYDDTEKNWVQVGGWDSIHGRMQRHRGNCAVSAFGKTLVGDYTNGKIYEMSMDFKDDDLAHGGARIRWSRRAPHLINEHKRIDYSEFELLAETGVGDGSNADPLLGAVTPEADPQVEIRWSDDGGKTFGNPLQRSLGKQGENATRVLVDRCGIGRDRVWEVSGSAAVKLAITGARFEGKVLAG